MSRRKRGGDTPQTYDVGYGKPPTHTRFKTGVSGNPSGRKRGAITAQTIAQKILNGKIPIIEEGVKRSVSRVGVMLRSIANKAVKGDLKAAAFLMKFEEARLASPATATDSQNISALDEEIIAGFMRRREPKSELDDGGDNAHSTTPPLDDPETSRGNEDD